MSSSYTRSPGRQKHVHFADDYAPSELTLKFKLGPHDRPTVIFKIYVLFEEGKLPRVRVRTERPKDKTRRAAPNVGGGYFDRSRQGYPDYANASGYGYGYGMGQQPYPQQYRTEYRRPDPRRRR